MFVASHRTLIAFTLVLGVLIAVQGCSKFRAQQQSRAQRVTVDETAAAPTTQPTTDVADATTQMSEPTETADATTQASEPATEAAAPTTQPTDPIAEAVPTTAPAIDTPATQPAVAAATAPATRPADVPNVAIAERFAIMAQAPLRAPVVVDASWRAAASLLEAATRLAPDEPRFARLLVEARTRVRDVPGAIAALETYRRLAPNDQFAQVQQIDLYLTRMETADAKLKYLESLVAAEGTLAPEVRSHAAVRAAQTLLERSQPQQAETMLSRALEMNPLSLEALRTRLMTIPPGTSPEQMVASVVAMIRAAPADPGVSALLARSLATVGLHRAALPWFASAMQMYVRSGGQPDAQFFTDYIASLILNGDVNDAEQLLGQVLAGDSANLNAWTLRLVLAKSSGDAAKFDAARRAAGNAMANRFAMIRQAAGDKGATTRPIDSPGEPELPEPGPLMQQLASAGRNEVLQAFAETVASVAWQKIYFEQKPAEAVPWVGVLRTMFGEQNPLVARLEGWSFIGVGRPDEARVKLSAVAEVDPLAQLGLIKIAEPAAKERADADARRLLEKNPAGVIGVVLADALRERKIEIEPTADTDAIVRELDKFPKDFIRILDQPGLYYTIRLEPVKVGHTFGEPILLRVSVQNIGIDPLTIGSDGAIHQDLWFDAQTRGIAQQPFQGVAFDRIAGPLVLHPGESTSQVVRLNQGNLHSFLLMNPVPTLQLSASVMTNPTTTQQGIVPGLAGLRMSLPKLLERKGSPLNEQSRNKFLQSLSGGSPTEKVCTLELLAMFARGLGRAEADADSKAAAAQFRDLIRRSTRDADPNVRAYADYMSLIAASDDERGPIVERLVTGNWMQQIYALDAVQTGGVSKEVGEYLAQRSADALVRECAIATLELLTVQPAATQPTTAPATGPATAPATKRAPPTVP